MRSTEERKKGLRSTKLERKGSGKESEKKVKRKKNSKLSKWKKIEKDRKKRRLKKGFACGVSGGERERDRKSG